MIGRLRREPYDRKASQMARTGSMFELDDV
jgi:hypothetical protein